ncbi:type I restriction endonuclease [Helicobacter pylori]|nr:type I restriction endonuclease [Helicobacter pylori]
MSFEKWDYSLFHKSRANARDKKIIFFAIMKPLKSVRPTPNKTANQNAKKGLLSWKIKTLKRTNLLH